MEIGYLEPTEDRLPTLTTDTDGGTVLDLTGVPEGHLLVERGMYETSAGTVHGVGIGYVAKQHEPLKITLPPLGEPVYSEYHIIFRNATQAKALRDILNHLIVDAEIQSGDWKNADTTPDNL